MGPLQRQVLRVLDGYETLGHREGLRSDQIAAILKGAGYETSTASVAAAMSGMRAYRGNHWVIRKKLYSGQFVQVGHQQFAQYTSVWRISRRGMALIDRDYHCGCFRRAA